MRFFFDMTKDILIRRIGLENNRCTEGIFTVHKNIDLVLVKGRRGLRKQKCLCLISRFPARKKVVHIPHNVLTDVFKIGLYFRAGIIRFHDRFHLFTDH